MSHLSTKLKQFGDSASQMYQKEKARAHLLEQTVRERDAELALARPKLAALEAEAESYREEVKSVQALNARLKGRLESLRRSIGRPAEGALEPAEALPPQPLVDGETATVFNGEALLFPGLQIETIPLTKQTFYLYWPAAIVFI